MILFKKSMKCFLIAMEERNSLSVDSCPIDHNRTTCNECCAENEHQGLEAVCSHDQTSNHRTYKHTNGICHVVQSVHYFLKKGSEYVKIFFFFYVLPCAYAAPPYFFLQLLVTKSYNTCFFFSSYLPFRLQSHPFLEG